MATRKPASAKKTSTPRKAAARRTTSSGTASSRRTRARRTSGRRTTRTSGTRRRRPGLPTTIGSAIGMLIVTTLLEASWPVRIGLVLVVLVLGLVYLLWEHRVEIAASPPAERAATAPPDDGTPEAATTTTALDSAATDPDPTQGDPSHE